MPAMDAPRKRRWPLAVGSVAGTLFVIVAIGLFVLDTCRNVRLFMLVALSEL